MSLEAWGDGDDGMDGYYTEERVDELLAEARDEQDEKWGRVVAALLIVILIMGCRMGVR